MQPGWGYRILPTSVWGVKLIWWVAWASLVAQTVKRLSTMRKTWVRSLGQEDPLEKEMAPHSSILAWKIPWMEEPGRLQSMGSQRVRHNWVTSLTHYCLTGMCCCFHVLVWKLQKGWNVSQWTPMYSPSEFYHISSTCFSTHLSFGSSIKPSF